ncbi:hypothetical protein IHN32_06930 [Deinococcus sp. 14RED07]|uniref:hypothetical protein n=1 Tax=Deinococcus sp. 14RED07 TaxID=2745874 RepID=UPI001E352CE0|nr:hypothetical protein [Deinococcus sp. 14RED07]MCD0175681.1 hypothetical protein [Deinococcus sp. 14RED07]
MTTQGVGRPKIHVDRAEVRDVQEALDLHGGLLAPELVLLGYADQAESPDETLIVGVKTIIGRLYLPRKVRHGLSKEVGESTPGRTVNAAIDGAYIRLFIRRTPGQWTINNPKALGMFTSNMQEMPTVVLDQQVYYVCGKALGNGMTPRSLKRHLDVAASTLRRERRQLLVVGPDTDRYESIKKAFPDVVTFSEYTLAQAEADNTGSGARGDQP